MSQSVLEIENLTKIYRGCSEPAIKDLSFSVGEGEFFGFLGPNGAGKTTTISILCGLLKPTNGKVKLFNMGLTSHLDRIKQMIGVVPQEIALYPTLTARENLAFFGRMYGLSGTYLKQRIEVCLEVAGLTGAAQRKIFTYSGGMRRRANLVAATLHNPKLLLLDEPMVGIDVQSRNVMMNYLKSLNEKGTTIIYTTHYMEEAEKLCSRLAIIDRGAILIEGNPVELVAQDDSIKNLEELFIRLTGKSLRD